eukprot:6269568-Pyramimonas_sp.AAC.2
MRETRTRAGADSSEVGWVCRQATRRANQYSVCCGGRKHVIPKAQFMQRNRRQIGEFVAGVAQEEKEAKKAAKHAVKNAEREVRVCAAFSALLL